jgi:hypothetical protein
MARKDVVGTDAFSTLDSANNLANDTADLYGNSSGDIRLSKKRKRQLVKGEQVEVEGFLLTPSHLVIPKEATQEQFLKVGEILFALEGSIQWLIGDWLVGIDIRYGRTYDEMSQVFDRSEKTLQNWKSVAARVEPSRRRESLSFGHHEAIASMEPSEQEAWLARAAESNWSVTQLRREIRDTITLGKRPKDDREERFSATYRDVKRLFQKAKNGDEDAKKSALQAINELRQMLLDL